MKKEDIKDERLDELEKNLQNSVSEEKKEVKEEDSIEKVEFSKEEELLHEIGTLKADVEEWKQAYLRKQAEFQNYTKRREKEYNELKQYSAEEIIKKILPEVDNFERAIEAAKESKDFEALNKGVEMIFNHLQDILKSEGVEEINATGKLDPNYHHAVMVEDSDKHEADEIVKVFQKGYTLKGRVIRPAMVTVAKK